MRTKAVLVTARMYRRGNKTFARMSEPSGGTGVRNGCGSNGHSYYWIPSKHGKITCMPVPESCSQSQKIPISKELVLRTLYALNFSISGTFNRVQHSPGEPRFSTFVNTKLLNTTSVHTCACAFHVAIYPQRMDDVIHQRINSTPALSDTCIDQLQPTT